MCVCFFSLSASVCLFVCLSVYLFLSVTLCLRACVSGLIPLSKSKIFCNEFLKYD